MVRTAMSILRCRSSACLHYRRQGSANYRQKANTNTNKRGNRQLPVLWRPRPPSPSLLVLLVEAHVSRAAGRGAAGGKGAAVEAGAGEILARIPAAITGQCSGVLALISHGALWCVGGTCALRAVRHYVRPPARHRPPDARTPPAAAREQCAGAARQRGRVLQLRHGKIRPACRTW